MKSIRQTDPGVLERRILQTIREIRYGSVEVVIHDGRVVQIERREKFRIDEHKEPAGQPEAQPQQPAPDRTSGRVETPSRSSQ